MENQELTILLRKMVAGDKKAGDEALRLTLPKLRQIAQGLLSGEKKSKTLQPTALVNELYLRHLKSLDLSIQDRQHFYFFAARGMRRILIDHARAKRTAKRTVDEHAFPSGLPHWTQLTPEEVLALDRALDQLHQEEPRAAAVVELRYILGCTQNEAAEILGRSVRTLRDDWDYARVRLRNLIEGR
jgi:RNA polymerase sigma-70 factor, ECF subfamily